MKIIAAVCTLCDSKVRGEEGSVLRGLFHIGMLYRRELLKLPSLDVAGTCKVPREPAQFVPGHPGTETQTRLSESAGLLL